MLGEPGIGLAHQRRAKTLLRNTSLVARDPQYGLPLGIERESHAPNPVRSLEPKLLHIGVLRAGERVRMRSAQTRPVDP